MMYGLVATSTTCKCYFLFFIQVYFYVLHIFFWFFPFYEFVNLFKMFRKCCHAIYVVSKREDRADVISGSSLSFAGCHGDERCVFISSSEKGFKYC